VSEYAKARHEWDTDDEWDKIIGHPAFLPEPTRLPEVPEAVQRRISTTGKQVFYDWIARQTQPFTADDMRFATGLAVTLIYNNLRIALADGWLSIIGAQKQKYHDVHVYSTVKHDADHRPPRGAVVE
jgi:hypothetical protein